MENSARSSMCATMRGETSSMDPIENNCSAVSDETYLESPDDHLDSGLIMPRVGLLLHGLSDRNLLKRCWCYFPKMQTDDALFFKHFGLFTSAPWTHETSPCFRRSDCDTGCSGETEHGVPCISGLASHRAQHLSGSASRCNGE